MKNTNLRALSLMMSVTAIIALSGCAASSGPSSEGNSEERLAYEAAIDKPVNCTTAEADISALKSEKESGDTVPGVLGYLPVGLVTNLATAPDDKEQESLDNHNKKLDAKIAEIKKACNIK